MEGYSFFEGSIPSGFTLEFEPFLFSEPAHRYLQSDLGWHSYYIIHQEQKAVYGAIHFHIEGGNANSPLKSPFGSVQLAESVPADTVFEFLKFLEVRLKSKGASAIVIKNYPQGYDQRNAVLLAAFLFNLNYQAGRAEISTIISVSDNPVEDLFHHSEVKRLTKATQASLSFRQLHHSDFDKVYAFIDQCRQEKKYSLSMTQKELLKVVQKFPDRILFFGVFKDEELISASISMLVNKNILYDFYHDHTSRFDNLSPVVFLVAGIYGYCQVHGVRQLDLGTSSLGNVPNFPLLRFKNNLGGQPSLKMTFEKRLA